MDVFDEGIGDDVIPEDWAKVERLRRTNGFREGLAAGQEASLQEGFNLGFSEGTEAKFTVSFIKGIISALITSEKTQAEDSEAESPALPISELEAMMSDLDCLRVEPSLKEGHGDNATEPNQDKADKDSSQGAKARSSDSTSSSRCECAEDGQERSKGATGCESKGGEGACCSNAEAQMKGLKNARPDRKKEFYSRNKALHEICDKLLPHLAKLQCENVLTDSSHPFLKL